MLTKNDLQLIGQLLDQKLDAKLEPIKQDVGTLRSDVDVLKKQAKITNRRLRKVEKDVSVAIDKTKLSI